MHKKGKILHQVPQITLFFDSLYLQSVKILHNQWNQTCQACNFEKGCTWDSCTTLESLKTYNSKHWPHNHAHHSSHYSFTAGWGPAD